MSAPDIPASRKSHPAPGARRRASEATNIERPFEVDPLLKSLRLHGLDRVTRRVRIAGYVILAGWLPVFLLALLQTAAGSPQALPSLLIDIKFHANFLVAAPIFVIADVSTGGRLTEIIRHFSSDSLVPPKQLTKFRQLVRTAGDLVTSAGATAAIAVIAYGAALLTVYSYGTEHLTAWHLTADRQALSPGGWWHLLVSLPLFAGLLLGWIWRLIVWGWLLASIARLDLDIHPGHPDRAGGLGFVGYSLRALAPIGFAVGVLGAGTVGEAVLSGTASPITSGVFASVLAVTALAVCSLPIFMFMPRLMTERWRSVFIYDALALRLNRQLDRRWLAAKTRDHGLISTPDFSTSADLNQVVANVHSMRAVPMDLRSVAFFIIATLLPFVPLLFLAVPPKDLLNGVRSLLL